MIRKAALLVLALLLPFMAHAQGPARIDVGASSVTWQDVGWWQAVFGPRAMDLSLALDQAVPYRVFLVGDPARLVIDLKGANLTAQDLPQIFGHDLLHAVRSGSFQRGWSRIVLELPGPYRVASAGMDTRGALARLDIALWPVAPDQFTPRPSAAAALRNLPDPAVLSDTPIRGEGLVVTLDPGHGGFDPGAQSDDITEAELVLTFALELREAMQAKGITVNMTRDKDDFVALEQRMTSARAAGSHLLISLHADALPKGQAAGATVYVWSNSADDRAARQLAARHERKDLLLGMDLTGQDDALAHALMDFARTDTQPRSEGYARQLTSRMALKGIGLHARPVQGAAFSVLKSPDITSVLLELGFITDGYDRAKMSDPLWRGRMVQAVTEATLGWWKDEAARGDLLRR